jgi:hypothetical protein
MTDPREAGPLGPRPDRLQRWFGAEIRAAEQDVERGLVTISGTPRARLGSRGIAGGAVAAAGVVVLLAVALTSSFLGGAVGPSPSAGTAQPTASSRVVVGPDGIPVSIDGAPVLNASAALARALASIDPTSFLVGGWLSDAKAACPTALTPQSPLLDTGLCGGQPALLDSPPVDARGQPAVDWNGPMLWPVFLDGSSPPEPRPSGDLGQAQAFDLAVVLRVHTHDGAAATCAADVRAQCDLAVVVDAVVWRATVPPAPLPSPLGALYPDGIPMTLGGEAVLRPTQAAARAAASTDASTFLVGGWVSSVFPYAGCPLPSGSAAELALDAGFCASYLTEAPANDVVGPLKLHFEASVPGWAGAGAVIVRVHTHDPLAASCDPPNVDACEHAVVVDAMVWNGLALGSDGLPTAIEGQPTITVPDALDRLASSTDATPYLVRGWYASLAGLGGRCHIPATVPPTPGSSLLPEACDPSLLGASPIAIGQEYAAGSYLNLTLGPGVDAPPNGAVVLEIHGHDPASAACDPSIRVACEAAVVVDRVVWTASTGLVALAPSAAPGSVEIPSSIDGQPVLRGAAFVDRVAHATDETSFLVGGWTPTTPEVYFCALIPAPSPGASIDPAAQGLCGGLWFLDAPGDPQGVLRGSPPWVAVRIDLVTTVPAWGAPFVMRVHVHQRSVIEDALVWVGLSPSR